MLELWQLDKDAGVYTKLILRFLAHQKYAFTDFKRNVSESIQKIEHEMFDKTWIKASRISNSN